MVPGQALAERTFMRGTGIPPFVVPGQALAERTGMHGQGIPPFVVLGQVLAVRTGMHGQGIPPLHRPERLGTVPVGMTTARRVVVRRIRISIEPLFSRAAIECVRQWAKGKRQHTAIIRIPPLYRFIGSAFLCSSVFLFHFFSSSLANLGRRPVLTQ